MITFACADVATIGLKNSKVWTWDSPCLFRSSVLKNAWQEYLDKRHGVFDTFVDNKQRINAGHDCMFFFVVFCFFLVCKIFKQTQKKQHKTVTVQEEDELWQQQRDLLNTYKELYGEWCKIPTNKIAPSFKLLNVDKKLGIQGLFKIRC